MANDKESERDGNEPLEEVGPTEAEVSPAKTEKKAEEGEGKPQESQVSFSDEVGEQYKPSTIQMGVSPEDGLPLPMNESSVLALAPAFSHDNVICIEDSRQFVEVFTEELRPEETAALARMNAPHARSRKVQRALSIGFYAVTLLTFAISVQHGSVFGFLIACLLALFLFRTWRNNEVSKELLFGTRSRFSERGAERLRVTFQPSNVKARFEQRYARLAKTASDRPGFGLLDAVLVRPIREGCTYYKRQLFANDEVADENAAGHKILFRNCTKRRSVGGAYMSLRDEAVYACDYRSPPTQASAEMLRATDDKILASSANRTLVPLFNLTAKLPKKD